MSATDLFLAYPDARLAVGWVELYALAALPAIREAASEGLALAEVIDVLAESMDEAGAAPGYTLGMMAAARRQLFSEDFRRYLAGRLGLI